MKKILFVDDEKELHTLMQEHFPKEKFRLICAGDGLEGMQKCRNEDFDLIILDYKLPKLDGVKFFRQLRDLQIAKKVDLTPVIFLSGWIEDVKAQTNLKFERCEFLEKPLNFDDLNEKMLLLRKQKGGGGKSESRQHLNPGEILYHEGDEASSIYLVMSGKLKGTKAGKEFHFGPGEVIGEVCILIKEKRIMTVEATEKSEVMVIPGEKILSVLNAQPKLIRSMLESMGQRLFKVLKE